MNFGVYDLLSQLIPGFVVYLSILRLSHQDWCKDYVFAATVLAFLLGYFVNALGSWLEWVYFWTWRGKPSTRLLEGKDISKVRFFHAKEAVESLSEESQPESSMDALFSIALRHATGVKDSRIESFNASYAFSRNILTACLLVGFLLYQDYLSQPLLGVAALALIFMAWKRCKERAYYLAREVLQVYLRLKKPIKHPD